MMNQEPKPNLGLNTARAQSGLWWGDQSGISFYIGGSPTLAYQNCLGKEVVKTHNPPKDRVGLNGTLEFAFLADSKRCWCSWSRNHTLRTTALDGIWRVLAIETNFLFPVTKLLLKKAQGLISLSPQEQTSSMPWRCTHAHTHNPMLQRHHQLCRLLSRFTSLSSHDCCLLCNCDKELSIHFSRTSTFLY